MFLDPHVPKESAKIQARHFPRSVCWDGAAIFLAQTFSEIQALSVLNKWTHHFFLDPRAPKDIAKAHDMEFPKSSAQPLAEIQAFSVRNKLTHPLFLGAPVPKEIAKVQDMEFLNL